ncbi:hypothetical protein [Sphingomicrobium astaxanthinifaciens]|uniref:hypothetical protein n=1 Tax=Sphingomicrobium astaxanthinifaciens TaxID=1227949 RepID=UPI001FCB263E|nr:hypothetical protein [Sphingomicrobium astaxanthinifaciens]MCJ7421632.1 hypothetical protein [Sphingomicrobium astaxanthinifaciens]
MRGFGSILWTAGIAVAVLACYLVSLQVASSRADLEEVERQIALTTREIRTLETEIGTRGRLAQLERWNVNFLKLSAPQADQFAASAYMVAAMAAPERGRGYEGPVILASAPAEAAVGAGALVHQASLSTSKRPRRGPTIEGEGPEASSGTVSSPAAPTTARPEPPRDPLAPLPAGDARAAP